MNRDFIILQVRIRSTRLPGKILLPLKGGSIFEHILRRLRSASGPDGIIVATTADTAPLIQSITRDFSAELAIGDEDDVLSRYVGAIDQYGVKNVIRATGDNPLVSVEYLDRSLLLHRESSAHLTTFPQLPCGTGVEVIDARALKQSADMTSDPFEREHITQYIYGHEDIFTVVKGIPEHPLVRPDVKLSVDTMEDYKKMADIYENLYSGVPIKISDVIRYLDGKRNL
jgi:spore coat polysaccharide biosynthesis protein SpsF